MATTLLFRDLIDGTGSDPVHDAAVRIDGDRIAWVGKQSALTKTRDDAVVDCGETTALPGLVNCHEHMGIDAIPGQALEQYMAEPIEYISMRAVKNARTVLRAGNTTIRDMAARGRVSAMVRRLINERIIPGPRMIIAGRNIVRTGGYGWFIGRTADGPDAFRQAIRDEIRENNIDHVKLMVTGGLAVASSNFLQAELTDAELHAAIDEAHRLGRKVAAHGYGGDGAHAAIVAGVDSIEHGAMLTEEDVDAMVKHGTYLVSTIGILEKIADAPVAPEFTERARSGLKRLREILGDAKKSRLHVAVGTDPMHGRLFREIEFLVESGYSAIDAIGVATRAGAQLAGVADLVGTLEVGKVADVIGVPTDVLSNVARLRDVSFVMKDGVTEFGVEGFWDKQ